MVSKIICGVAVMLVLAISTPQEKVANFHAGDPVCNKATGKKKCSDDLGGTCTQRVLKCGNGKMNAIKCTPGAGSVDPDCKRSRFCTDDRHATRDSNCDKPRAAFGGPVG